MWTNYVVWVVHLTSAIWTAGADRRYLWPGWSYQQDRSFGEHHMIYKRRRTGEKVGVILGIKDSRVEAFDRGPRELFTLDIFLQVASGEINGDRVSCYMLHGVLCNHRATLVSNNDSQFDCQWVFIFSDLRIGVIYLSIWVLCMDWLAFMMTINAWWYLYPLSPSNVAGRRLQEEERLGGRLINRNESVHTFIFLVLVLSSCHWLGSSILWHDPSSSCNDK